jgi:hypothetical protein
MLQINDNTQERGDLCCKYSPVHGLVGMYKSSHTTIQGVCEAGGKKNPVFTDVPAIFTATLLYHPGVPPYTAPAIVS